jgi:hypothetical protein
MVSHMALHAQKQALLPVSVYSERFGWGGGSVVLVDEEANTHAEK